MEYIAHIAESGETQTVKQYLENVAQMASNYALPEFKILCYAAGIADDIGKYTKSFQDRILHGGKKTEHSIQGAKECQIRYNKSNFVI